MKHALAFVVSVLAAGGASKAQSPERVSVGTNGVEGNAASFGGQLSADGRKVAFVSHATNLVAADTNGSQDVFVRDRVSGTTQRVSVGTGGVEGNSASDFAAISADGRFVSFMSYSSNLVAGDTNGREDVFVHDLVAGTTVRASVDSAGAQAHSGSTTSALSGDGRYVVFSSEASNLVPGDTNGQVDTFVRDLVLGVTERVSVSSSGVQASGPSGADPTISRDGRFAGFTSWATNLVPGDTNSGYEPFVRDRLTGATVRAHVSSSGLQGDIGNASGAILAPDGRSMVFWSNATNLVPGDLNGRYDDFVRDLVLGTTSRVSVSSARDEADGHSGGWLALSGDGRYVAFSSSASNLVADDANGASDAFVHDRLDGRTVRISAAAPGVQANGPSQTRSISANGRLVCFQSDASNVVANDTNGARDVFVVDWIGFEPHAVVCAGDGSGTPCPCGNWGVTWRGCENSFATGGASLSSSGDALVSADTLELEAAALPPATPVLFFQGTSAAGDGAGLVFGDGLRCASGAVVRLGTKNAVASATSFGPAAGDAAISLVGGIPPLGGTRVYQAWYRNAAPFCSASTYNLSNGWSVAWRP